LKQNKPQEQPVTAIAFSNRQWLAVAVDKQIKMLSRETWDTVHTLSHEDSVQMFAFSRDGQRLSSETGNDVLWVWMAPWDKPRQGIKIPLGVTDEAFSPDLRYFVVAQDDGTIRTIELPRD
jgi:WD40 repeat protein